MGQTKTNPYKKKSRKKKILKPAIRANLPPNKVVRDKTKYTRKKKHQEFHTPGEDD